MPSPIVTAERDYNQAIADYDKAIKLYPSYALAYLNRGNAYEAQGDHSRAIADYNEAIKLSKKNRERHGDEACFACVGD